MVAAKMASRLGVNEASVWKMGGTASDSRVERAIIRTDGRIHCMCRAGSPTMRRGRGPEEGGMIADATA